MTESTQRFNPETGKPNPVSVREFYLMDRKEQRAFLKPLSQKENWRFSKQFIVLFDRLSKAEKRELTQKKIEKLQKNKSPSVGDRIELFFAELRAKQQALPSKPPIFFRKFRTGERQTRFPKWMTKTKSPYLISGS